MVLLRMPREGVAHAPFAAGNFRAGRRGSANWSIELLKVSGSRATDSVAWRQS
jgi:hypothetical protein